MGKKCMPQRGFTLIELMVAVAVVAILAAVALPAYTRYVARSRVPPGLDALSAYAVRMEQYYQDTGSYTSEDGKSCGVKVPDAVENYTITCALETGDKVKGFMATATGSGLLTGYAYTIDGTGTRVTTAHPIAKPTKNCWSIRGSICDA